VWDVSCGARDENKVHVHELTWGVMVKSADRVMQILEAIGSSEEGKTHGELSSTLNIPKISL
jgi:hypothetical protein